MDRIKYFVAALLGLVVTPAWAQTLPPEAAQAFADVSAQVGEMLSLAWPIVLLVTGGLIAIKLFKRVIGRAT